MGPAGAPARAHPQWMRARLAGPGPSLPRTNMPSYITFCAAITPACVWASHTQRQLPAAMIHPLLLKCLEMEGVAAAMHCVRLRFSPGNGLGSSCLGSSGRVHTKRMPTKADAGGVADCRLCSASTIVLTYSRALLLHACHPHCVLLQKAPQAAEAPERRPSDGNSISCYFLYPVSTGRAERR